MGPDYTSLGVQAADPPITVEKGMNRLELHVSESRADEDREMVFGVKKTFELGHAIGHA